MATVLGEQLPLDYAIHAYQLNGKGGTLPLKPESSATTVQPFWIHLNYSDEENGDWLKATPLIENSARDALVNPSPRPRVVRLGEGTLITLRTINFTNDNLPDPLVGLRVYITDNLIISSRNRLVAAIDTLDQDLSNNIGPVSTGDWLVQLSDALVDQASEFIDDLHAKIIELEDSILAQEIPERGEMALIRKQLIILRRYLVPQRDVFSRLSIEKLTWMTNADRHRMQDIAERLGRAFDDVDASISKTTVLSDEINNLLAEGTNKRVYLMSLFAMLFLPATFLTGLFGVNLGGIPGADHPKAFMVFCVIIVGLAIGIFWWLRKRKWL